MLKQGGTAFFNLGIGQLEVVAEPRVIDVLVRARKLQELVFLVLRVATGNPVHVVKVFLVHPDQVVVLVVVAFFHERGVVAAKRHVVLS